MAAGSSLRFRIEQDVRETERFFRMWPGEAPKAVSRALNKTADASRTAAKREISRISGLKSSFVNAHLKTHKATRSRLTAEIVARSHGILLSQLPGTKQTQKGISWVGAGRRRHTILHAFIHGEGEQAKSYIRMSAAQAGEDAQGKFGLVGRLPVRYLWAPNLVTIFGSRKVWRIMEARAAEQWPKEIGHQVSYIVSRIN